MELRKYKFENTEKVIFNDLVGLYDIPAVQGITDFESQTEFLPFNFCKTDSTSFDKGVHFFIDDYQFSRIWNRPEVYAGFLAQYRYMLSPDYSLFTDSPLGIQIYKHYQKQWFGAFAEKYGAKVISTLCWSSQKSFSFCFDGIKRGSVVAVSSVGTQRNKESQKAFLDGYFEGVNRIEPSTILFFGNVPKEIKPDNLVIFQHMMGTKFKNLR